MVVEGAFTSLVPLLSMKYLMVIVSQTQTESERGRGGNENFPFLVNMKEEERAQRQERELWKRGKKPGERSGNHYVILFHSMTAFLS